MVCRPTWAFMRCKAKYLPPCLPWASTRRADAGVEGEGCDVGLPCYTKERRTSVSASQAVPKKGGSLCDTLLRTWVTASASTREGRPRRKVAAA